MEPDQIVTATAVAAAPDDLLERMRRVALAGFVAATLAWESALRLGAGTCLVRLAAAESEGWRRALQTIHEEAARRAAGRPR